MGYGNICPDSEDDINKYSIVCCQDSFLDIFKPLASNEKFWMNIEPYRPFPEFPVAAYITYRACPKEVTERWLEKIGAPKAPVIYTDKPENKLEAMKYGEYSILVEDRAETFAYFKNSGVPCLLWDRPWNRHEKAGTMRVWNWNDVEYHIKTLKLSSDSFNESPEDKYRKLLNSKKEDFG